MAGKTKAKTAKAAKTPKPTLTRKPKVSGGKRIGFLDWELDNFHSHTYLRVIRGPLLARGFEVAGCTAMNETAGRKWADINHVPYFQTPKELSEAVDAFAILAPNNPQVHLSLCEAALPLRKVTFVDKTFAPDLRTAKEIFALADRHAVPLYSSSALRYTDVQRHVRSVGGSRNVRHMTVFAPGGSFDNYVVHPLELLVSSMGADARELMRRGSEQCPQLLVNYRDGRTATVNLYCQTHTPYAAAVTTAQETQILTVDLQKLFVDAAGAMLDFFESAEPPFDRAETLLVMRLRDVARRANALKGFVKL